MKRFLATLTLSTAVLSFVPVPLVAQTNRPQPPAPGAAAAYTEPVPDAATLRERFREVLNRYPRNVGNVLRLDPTLFNDADYLGTYPALASFVAQYPEVARNADYYLSGYGGFSDPYRNRDPSSQAMEMFRNFFEAMTVLLVVMVVGSALIWVVKGIIEHRRWLRMSKIQTEVHTKLLDRFSSSEELLAYIKTPAGSRFLESAPISVDLGAPSRTASAPLNRILWSVQAGVVLLLAGAGSIQARHQITVEELKQMFYVIGIFGSFIGIGFILSALASYVLSQRLGLLDGTGSSPAPSVAGGRGPVDSAGL